MADVKKIALVFSGQGAQYPGMGKSLYDSSPAAKSVFDEAGDRIKEKCFHGTAEELKETSTTQPAVYTVDMAAFAALNERISSCVERSGVPDKTGQALAESSWSIEITALAGFSLGEYAAFTAAGIIPSIQEGFNLVCKRSQFMADAGRYPDGSARGVMAAVLGDKEDILAIVEISRGDDVLEAVNFNSAGQTVIAGDADAVARFSANAKESGKRLKAIPLAVSTAFHSPIMEPASVGIKEAAAEIEFGNATHPVYLNLTGEAMDPASSAGTDFDYQRQIQSILADQVKSPVQWQKTIESIAATGVDAIIELGPGKTLTGLTKKNAPGVLALHVEDADSLEETVAALR